MSPQQGRRIAIVGGTGTVGEHILSALLSKNVHTITAISRTESTATFPSAVNVKKGSYSDSSFLNSVLQGQEVLILIFPFQPMEAIEAQIPFIEAAAKAGVKWVLPTEFGSDTSSSLGKDFPMTGAKQKYQDLIEKLGMKWVAVVNNPWFDWNLKRGMWSINIPERKAVLNNVGNTKFNTTTLAQVGRGVSALLTLPDESLAGFKNRSVYLSSFQTNQREILDSVLRATGTKESDWEVVTQEPEVTINAAREEVAKGNWQAFIGEFYTAHMQEGRGGNYETKAAKDREVLGIQEESLDEAVKRVVAEL
jgi:uncharacterized protein YbjT (DUF2867 family)